MLLTTFACIVALQHQSFNWELNSKYSAGKNYVTKELRVPSDPGVTLSATLFLPSGRKGPVNGVILTNGSEVAPRSLAFYQISGQMLASNGIAALIYDNRGVGSSTGKHLDLPDLHEPARDLIALAKAMRAIKGVSWASIGIMGFSQGGWVAPLAAKMSKKFEFVLAIAAPSATPLEEGIYCRSRMLANGGTPKELVDSLADLQRATTAYMQTGKGYEALKARFDVYKTKSWWYQVKNAVLPPLVPPVERHDPKWAAYVDPKRISYNPEPALTSLDIPSLWLLGDDDYLMDTFRTEKRIKKLKADGKPAQVMMFRGTNHGMVQSISNGQATFPKGYWDAIIDFVKARGRHTKHR